MDTIRPSKLKLGDVVGVISPSSPVVSKRELSRGLKILESLGFKPKLGPKALEIHASYQAGTRKDRLYDLHSMFADDEVKAIFCTSGGYASMQLLPDIDWEIIRKNPKIFIGYSDITTLLIPMSERTGLVTFHGPMIQGLDKDTKGGRYTLNNMKNTLMKNQTGRLPAYTEWKVLKEGKAEGTLIGGNLNVLLSLIGTPYEPKWDGKILFWEEVDETIEGLDNYMWRLRIAKVFKKIEGMVVGKVTNLQSIEEENDKLAELDKPPVLEDVILRATEGYNFPILFGADFGHDVPSVTLPIGAKALINCPTPRRVGALSIEEKYLE
ncbi:MAG: Peptidase U61 LD-carboxypeptidase A [Candidatus Jorgensenbacteria bacterium GW2011_GWA2_45_13]|uniref:Peptidase U61 LD-carboxypeptidase A n=1 Tax=Candidatus Jorgensenbacteria bacterium GW2011_GWA2_45_13 TaxID=1618662 RepID=A0A0G1L586_9BACT|nr:MAG: Peptidase U61 LD-carboxypeptidase A [Candidatus Jorgensenbacteria bacterium GW2011_GWA2_45_13]